MPPSLGDRLEHILNCIANLEKIFANTTEKAFADDPFLRAAAERFFEIISEASRHIPDELKSRETQINWRRMADLGNWLRHAYDQVDTEILWSIARNDLAPLKVFVERLVRDTDAQ
ncbi:MAG: DUF86 domain-containing protein [Xanthobacteraceae bacterium]